MQEKIQLDKTVLAATAKVCGLGLFHFVVNGEKAGDHEMNPAWTDYRKLILYVIFDIRDALHKGENVIGAEVGNGWYVKEDVHYTFQFPEFMSPNPNPYKFFGKYLILAIQVIIDYEDGTQEIVETDETFCVMEHSVVMSNVYGSEIIDKESSKELVLCRF